MKLNILTCTALCVSMASININAQESRWGLGLGGMADRQGYVDVDSKITIIPIITYESEDFRINGPKFEYKLAKYKLPEYGTVKLSFIGQYRFDGYDESDGDIFIGMEERSEAFELGFSVGYRSKFGGLTFEFLTDASSKHEGYEASFTYAKPYFFDSFIVEPYLGVTRLSSDYVDYYYGVNSDEALAFRPAYFGEATTNGKLGVRANWQAEEHHSFILNASYSVFGNEIENSPLVEESGGGNLILGYVYVF